MDCLDQPQVTGGLLQADRIARLRRQAAGAIAQRVGVDAQRRGAIAAADIGSVANGRQFDAVALDQGRARVCSPQAVIRDQRDVAATRALNRSECEAAGLAVLDADDMDVPAGGHVQRTYGGAAFDDQVHIDPGRHRGRVVEDGGSGVAQYRARGRVQGDEPTRSADDNVALDQQVVRAADVDMRSTVARGPDADRIVALQRVRVVVLFPRGRGDLGNVALGLQPAAAFRPVLPHDRLIHEIAAVRTWARRDRFAGLGILGLGNLPVVVMTFPESRIAVIGRDLAGIVCRMQ